MRNFLRRAGWLSLVILFVGTSLGIGIWAFWVNTHQKNDTAASKPKTTKLAGTKLQNYEPIAKVDSLKKIDEVPGTGTAAKSTSTITVSYTGALASTGVIFESSQDTGQPVTFALNQVIKGWQEGLPGMKVGGTRRLLIPSALAYGPQTQGSIPPNSDLVFEVTLLAVK